MARMDPSANSARTDKVRPAAVLQKPADSVRGKRDEERVSSNIAARPEPATESHAALSASLHESFGNSLIQSALAGSLEGPAPLISAALTMGAAGLGPDSASGGALSNSGVAAYMAARDALPTPEIFARDADSRVKAAAARGGKPLPEFARNRLEAAFGGVDFSGVRLHNDGAANQASKAINAKAYTVGQNVYLGHGYDNLQDRSNLRLLIHELTHVVQHMEGRLQANTGANQTEGGMAVSSPTDAVELEAENMATSLLPSLDGSILAPMDAELSVGQGMELGAQSAEVGEQSAASAGVEGAALRSRDDDNSALDKQAQGGEQNQDQIDGRQNDQESLEGLGEWKSTIKAQNEKMEALGERISMWDSLDEAERKTLWREALSAVLVLSKVALQAIGAALESSEAGLKLGAKLQAVGSLLSLVGWALGDAGPATGEVKDERTKENKDSKDPTEPRFASIVGWVQETIGGDTGVDFGALAIGKVLEGARKLQDAMTAFLEGVESLTSGVNELKQVKDQKEGQAAKDSKKLDSKQIQKTLSKLSERSEALSAKLSGDAGAEKTPDTEAETGPTEDMAATDVADSEQQDAALHGLDTATVKAHGAGLQNAPKKLQKHWTGQLEAGTNLGVEKPMRRWTKVKVLDGDQKGAWGYIDRHFFKGRNKEPGRAATKEKRMTRPTRETLHRNASGAMGRAATSERPTGGGQSLPASLKEAFRPILGRSIDSVRIHTDSAAADFAIGVAANAVTVGRDIYFAPGTFSESGDAAKTLLAEELHHAVLGGGKPGVSQPGDDHERKARAFAEGTVGGGLLEVIDATFGETLTPAKAQGRKHHPRRALQKLKNAVPTKMLRQLGDALGTSQGSGLQPGAPGVGLRHMGVGGTPKRMRAPKKVTPSATPTPDKRVANRNAAVDAKRRAQMDKVFGEYENMSFAVSLTTDKGRKATVKVSGVETPYRINGSNVERKRGDHRSADRKKIPAGKAGSMAALGKASASQVQAAIQGAIKAGTVTFTKVPDKWLNAAGNKLTGAGAEGIKAKIRTGLKYKAKRGSANLLGVDCSGFTYQIILKLAQAEGHKGGEWGTTPLNVGTGTMKTAKNMRTITAPGEMRTADLMLFGGHVEAIYSITPIDAATWKKEGTGDAYPKNGGVWKISTMESSPDGAQREGTRKSTWYAMQTVTERAGKKPTSKVQFWKNKGTRTWHSPTVKVRRAKLLEETEPAAAKAAAASDSPGVSEVQLRGTISRNPKGSVARNTSVPLPEGGGQALPAKVIEQLSSVFGTGLEKVRIHTGPQAQAASEGIAANAFTSGMNIFFNKGMFNPQNEKGLGLLAEELHHALVGGGGPGISQPGDAHEKAAGSFVEQLLNPNKDDPSAAGGGVGSRGLSRQPQEGATAAVAPDLSGYTNAQLQQLVYGSDGSQRYKARGPGWQAADAGSVTLEMFQAAREALMDRGALGNVHNEGMNQDVYNTYGQNALASGMHERNQDNGGANLGGNFAATQGTPPAPTPLAQPGSSRITDYRTAKDGRRYAIATGVDGKNVVIWGGKDTSDAELRDRANAKLPSVPGVAEEPKPSSLWDRTEKETVLLQASGSKTFVDESVIGDSWNDAETIGGGKTSGSYDVLGVEAGGDSKAEITTDGAKAHAAVTAKAQLVAWKQKWEWETPPLSILNEDFTATFFVSVDAFVGAEARAQISAQIEKSKGGRTVPGDEILAGMDTSTTQTASGTQTTATGPTAAVDASAGVFAGAKLRLGAGLAGNWVKKPQGAYQEKITDNIGSMIDGIAASVPGLGWVVQQVGADQIVKSLLEKVLTWGSAGATPILGVEGTAEGSLGVGAQVAAKVGFKGGKFSMEFGANATWGVGLGAKVSVTIDAIEGVKLALVVGGELYKYARDWVTEKAGDFSDWAGGLWDSFMGWFSADDKVREMVANNVHMCVDASKRAQMLRTLMGGWTGGDDEQAMMSILRYSKAAGDLSQVTAIVSASELRGELGSMVNAIVGSPPRRRGRRRSRNASGLAPSNGMAIPAPRGGGQVLPTQVYSKLAPMFGSALNEVKIHTGTDAQGFAQGLNANAVTQGTHIFFNKATFDPGSSKGMELIIEEVHHAIVGGGGPGISKPGDAHEKDAKGLAARLVGGGLLDTIDNLLAQGAGEGTASEQTQADPKQILGQLGGSLPPAIQARLRQQLGLQDGESAPTAQGSAGASLQEQASGPSVTPTETAPDLSGASNQALRSLVFADSGTQRYRRSGGTWTPVEPGSINLATFIAAREQLMSQSGMGGVTHGGRNQALFNTYSQNTMGAGSHADNAQSGAVNLGGAFVGTGARPTSGRDQISDFRTARDGRRYAVATGADGRNVVVWGARDSSDEDLRQRTDRQLESVHGAPQRNNAWDRTDKEIQLYGHTSSNVWADTSVAGDAWNNAEGLGGSTTSGSYDVLGFEAGGKTRLEANTNGVELEAAVEARAQLFEWKQKWEWETEQYTLLGESFSGTFFVSVDAFVGAEAKARIMGSIQRSQGSRTVDGDAILGEMDTQTTANANGTTETVAQGPSGPGGPSAGIDASAGAFAGAKVRLGAGMAANWHKKDQGAYSSKMQNTIKAGIDTASSAVPGLGWVMRQVGADTVVERLISSVLTWGPQGKVPVLGVEGTGEGSLGVGAQINAKVGFSGGKLSFTWGANVTWGVGLGAKVSVNIDALEGIKLALIVGGELVSIATDWIGDAVSDMAGFGASLWESFWGLFSGDDKVREAVANDAHKLADAAQRGEMLKKLMSGWTGGDDQEAMIQILRFSHSNGDMNAVLAVADKGDVRGELDGDRRNEFKRMVGE